MVRSCPPNAWRISRAAVIDRDRLYVMIAQNIGTISPAGTASGCMRWLGGTTPEGRTDLPAMLALAGGAWDGGRMRSFPHADGRDDGRMRSPRWRPRAVPAIPFPPGRRSDACRWDHVRRRSRRCPVQARDAFPVMALGCPIRTRWRFGRSNHGVESGVGFAAQRLLVPAQRLAHQPRRRIDRDDWSVESLFPNRRDLARRNGVRLHALVGRHSHRGA